LLARSVDFDPFFDVLKGRYSDAIDRIVLISLIGQLWDRAEPSGFAGVGLFVGWLVFVVVVFCFLFVCF
jgi:hypothetical protein